MPAVGRTIGRYEVLRPIGRGGMAVVYLARQTDLQRLVAVKELQLLHDDDPSYARRFLREARLAGSLSDPNVVTVYEYLEYEGTPYLAMEYLERGSLRPHVGEMNLPQVSGVLEGVLGGLVSAERNNIVHRDLKPENVMVTADGRVKIADFGIAKATTAMGTGAFRTATGVMAGTPAYMAPEQVMAQEVGPWTDLYAVGCMAFEFFTGRVPFHSVETPIAVVMRHVTEPIPPVKSIVGHVDERISDWIERLLVKDPQQRTRSAAEAWNEFEEITITLLGPRWRRESRLPLRERSVGEDEHPSGTWGRDTADAEEARRPSAAPYTPPPPDLPPGPMSPPRAAPQDAPPARDRAPDSTVTVRAAGTTPTVADERREPRRRRPARPQRWLAIGAAVLVLLVGGAVLLTRGGTGGEQRAAIPAGNLTGNPSFERSVSFWDNFQSEITRERASDAPDGQYVARVRLATEPDEYSIDDEPDSVVSSASNRSYTASAWVKATPATDGRRVCIAIREWRPGRDDDVFAGVAQASVTASTDRYRLVRVTYVAKTSKNIVDVHVFRYPPGVRAGESFLVDAITMTPGPSGGRNTQLVPEATCQSPG